MSTDDDQDDDDREDEAKAKPKRAKRKVKKDRAAPRPVVATLPSFFDGVMASVRLSYLRTLRGRKIWVAGIATLIVILFPAVVALLDSHADRAEVVQGGFNWGFFRLLLFLNPVLLCSGAIADEVEERTLPFLTMRATSRSALLIGRWIVATVSATAITIVGALLLFVIAYVPEFWHAIAGQDHAPIWEPFLSTLKVGGAATLLVACYSSMCLVWGVLVPEAATMISLIYLGIFELCMGLLPGGARFISMSHYARELAGLERWGWLPQTVPDIPTWGCVLGLVCFLGAFTGLAVAIFSGTQTRFGQA